MSGDSYETGDNELNETSDSDSCKFDFIEDTDDDFVMKKTGPKKRRMFLDDEQDKEFTMEEELMFQKRVDEGFNIGDVRYNAWRKKKGMSVIPEIPA